MIGDILQPTHLIFVLVIALLVLGPKRLPEVGRSLGKGLRDFKSALSGDDHDEEPEALSPTVTEEPRPAETVHAGVEPTEPLHPVEPAPSPGPVEAPGASAPAEPEPAHPAGLEHETAQHTT